MVIHFVVDEKIVDQIIDNFLSIDSANIFMVFTKHNSESFKYITHKGAYIRRFNIEKDDINSVIDSVAPKAIILHQLNVNFAKTINRINSKCKIAWIAWGFDVYGLPQIKPYLYAPKTYRFIVQNNFSDIIKWKLKECDFTRKIYYNIQKKIDPNIEIFNSIRRIDFFSTYIKEDFDFFVKNYGNTNLKYIDASFCTIDQYLAGNNNLIIRENASGVFLGNSNTLECNYIDVIKKIGLKKDNLKEVYCILSYGENDKHKAKVIKEGKRIFASNFYPQVDFVPHKQYLELLQSCSTGIFFHYRQQAMGNIIALLYMGARVYLSKKNPAYHFFLRNDIIVQCFETEFDIYLNSRLERHEVDNNRKQLDKMFNKDKVQNDLIQLLNKLSS